MSETNEFKYDSLQDSKSIAKYLNALKDGFLNGKIILANGNKRIELNPDGLLNLEVKAKRKNEKVKIQIKCTWKDGKEEKSTEHHSLSINPENEI